MTNPFSIRVVPGRLLGWLVAISLLNVIIDPPDYPVGRGESLDFNEIESICEWVLEEVADIENAIPEQEDEDNNQSEFKKDSQHWLVQDNIPFCIIAIPAISTDADQYRPALVYYHTDIVSPPPEIIA